MKKKFNLLIIVLFAMFLYGCSSGTDYTINLIDGYGVIKSSTDFISIGKSNGSGVWSHLIPKKIVEVGYNDEYIIAKQFDVLEKDDKFFVDETKENYWILDIKTEYVYGPFSYKEFNTKRMELNIDEDVKLKNLDEYEKKYS